MLRALDAAHVRRWAVACVQSLDAHREAIDRINVFPVADGDTGSNMLHTMRAALDALLRAPIPARTDAGAALAALARGALTGARGNSGVIVSQLLRGISDAVPRPDTSVAAARPAAATGAASAQSALADTASGSTSAGSASGGTASVDSASAASGGASAGSASAGTASVDSASADFASGGTSAGSASAGTDSVDSSFADKVSADSASGRASAGSASAGTASVDSASADFASGGTSAGTASGGTASVDSASAQAAADVASADSASAASAGAASPGSAAALGADSADAASNGVAASGDGRMRELSGAQLRAALASGARRAAAALADPVPGTMISVLAAAASAAEAEQSDELGTVVSAAAAGAAAALDETPRQLAVLAAAGVVDAGGRGVVVLLDALVAVVSEQPAALAAAQRARTERVPARPEQSMYTARESGSDAFAYEVMYLLEEVRGAGDPIGRLRDVLVGLGDCVSVVGDGDGLWTVHVHCNDVGAAIEVGVETGRPRQIRVARFADAPSAEASRFVQDRAVVVPARSSELADLLVREGVAVVRLDTDDTDETGIAYRLLEAITGTAAAHVTVLSSHASLIEVCDEASIRAVAAGQDVVVVPCASPVQVLAAVAVHDPRRRAGDDVVAMAEAAAATRRGEVVVSAEDAITWIGACASGDVLGLADGEVVLIEPGPPGVDALDRAACGVVERMLGAGGELITALLGADAPDELTDELTDYLRREHPETELVVYHGGQTDAVLIVGVE